MNVKKFNLASLNFKVKTGYPQDHGIYDRKTRQMGYLYSS